MTLPARLRAAVSEPPGPGTDRLIQAAAALAQQGVFGLVWLDETLNATARFGDLVAGIPIGQPVTLTVDPLFGHEEQIKALKQTPDQRHEVPNVAVVGADGASPRFNYSLASLGGGEGYLLLVSRVLSQSDLETELTQHVRRRILVEEAMVAQSYGIQQVNEELAAANRELSEFAHVISHDLKAPMRALRYSADDLERALIEPGSGGDPLAHVERLRQQTRRMSAMLSGLLTFAALGRRDEALEEIDTGALVREIVVSLPGPPGIEVAVQGSWPVVTTLAAPLDMVLRNLIENAIRHHDRDHGHVIVEARPQTDPLVLLVRDDGPGIPPDWHQAVFRPFTTVSGGEVRQPAGTGGPSGGMGLAIVLRAVELVGGRIAITSDPALQRGTTFEVHWPCAARPGTARQGDRR